MAYPTAAIVALSTFFAVQPSHLDAGELRLLRRIGRPITDRDRSDPGSVLHASWPGENFVVVGMGDGSIAKFSVADGTTVWRIRNVGKLDDWSFSKHTNRLAYRDEGRVFVLDCKSGKVLFKADSAGLARIIGKKTITPSRIAISPRDGRLLVCDASYSFGRNGYVLDSHYAKCISTFCVDAYPWHVSLSQRGDYAAIVAKGVLNVRAVYRNCDVFFRGRRIFERAITKVHRDGLTVVGPFDVDIDSASFSHIQYDGARTIVYSVDGGWSNGEIVVYDRCSRKSTKFDGHNVHVEVDVDFRKRRIAITGTSRDLSVFDFNGKELARKKGVAADRILCISFSPSGKRVVVGSWDNTLSVFSVPK